MTKAILIVITVMSLAAIVIVCAKETKAPAAEHSDSASPILESSRSPTFALRLDSFIPPGVSAAHS